MWQRNQFYLHCWSGFDHDRYQRCLCAFDDKRDIFTRIIDRQGLLGDIEVQGIQKDLKGKIWISSKNGLYQLSRYGNEWNARQFTNKDGLHGNDFSAGAAIMPHDQLMVFGGLNGFTYFDPQKIKKNDLVPEVLLQRVDLHQEAVDDTKAGKMTSVPVLEKRHLHISPDIAMFTIHFIALGYTNPSENKYKYKMSGFQDSWLDIGSERSVTFTNLDPGTYTFSVMASNNDGRWNPQIASVEIEVMPPWSKTKLAFIAYLLLFALLIYTTIQLRTRSLLASQKKLKAEVERRTCEIKAQNEVLDSTNYMLDEKVKEIEAQNEEISQQLENILLQNEHIAQQNNEINLKNSLLQHANEERENANVKLRQLNARLESLVEERTNHLQATLEKFQKTDSELNTFLYRSSHDLKGPMTTLLGLAVVAKKSFNDEEVLKFFDLVEDTSKTMVRNLKKLREVHLIFNKKPESNPVDLQVLVEKLLVFLDGIDKQGKVQKSVLIANPDKLEVRSDTEFIKIILENISENAIFYNRGEGATITVLMTVSSTNLMISVEDNGLGIDREAELRIFEMFYRGRENSKGAGLGLYTAKSAVDKLGGNLQFDSQDGHTTFEVILPLQV